MNGYVTVVRRVLYTIYLCHKQFIYLQTRSPLILENFWRPDDSLKRFLYNPDDIKLKI